MTTARPPGPVGTDERGGTMSDVAGMDITAGGRQRLQEELGALLACQRRAVLEYAVWCESTDSATGTARGAPPELDRLYRRIAELRGMLAAAGGQSARAEGPGAVGLGARVTVRWDDGTEEAYTIVEPLESDPRRGQIYADSPVGRALLDRCVGERVVVDTPMGPRRLAVLAVA